MKFEDVYRYSKDADTVMRMFSDRAYFEKKYAETTLDYEVLEHELSADTFRIRCKLTMPLNVPVPGFAKKFFGQTMNVVQEDTWDLKNRTGRLTVELAGVPVTVKATMALREGSGGGENHVNWDIGCNIPLVGNKVAKLVADDIQAKSPGDLSVSEKILAEY